MGVFDSISRWPVIQQILRGDLTALGDSAKSSRSTDLRPRTETADKVVRSICPYCAVGCGQLVFVQDGRITDIEGDPDSPISQGCLCPKGAATFQLVTGSHRVQNVLYRRPHGTAWETIPLEQAMEMVAQRVKKTRDETWQERTSDGERDEHRLPPEPVGGKADEGRDEDDGDGCSCRKPERLAFAQRSRRGQKGGHVGNADVVGDRAQR